MKENKLQHFFTWFLLGGAFLLPLLFLPYFINPFIISKLMLVFLISAAVLLAFLLLSFKNKSWQLTKTPLSLPLLIFGTLVIISSLASNQYPLKQFLGLGGAYLSFVLVVLLGPSLLKSSLSKWFAPLMNSAAIILSSLSILQVFGLGLGPLLSRVSSFELPNNLIFALTGATFITIQFLSAVLISNLFDKEALKNSWLTKVSVLLAAVALVINIRGSLPGAEAQFQSLSFVNSSNIALNSLAFTKNALLGYGPDSYGNAYSILKPLWINGTNFWKFTFDSAFNLPLTVIVSLGMLAFVAYLFFMVKTSILVKKNLHKHSFLGYFILASLFWQLFAPVNLVMLSLFSIALAFFIAANRDQYKQIDFKVHRLSDLINQGKWVKTRNYIFFGVNSLVVVGLVYLSVVQARAFSAYHYLYRGNDSIIKNEAALAYDYHMKAKDLAPQLDFIRRSNSTVNLQIAIALSNKADADQAEQEQVLQLVNQAIREAKAATVLDPANYKNWLTLATVYLQLVGTTDQAAQEAFNALAKAATSNPNDPEIRLVLGELFFKTGRNQDAIVFFNQAIERKPDLFVAHYYLAKALQANGQLEDAKTAFTNSMGLADKASEDYKIIQEELEALTKQIEEGAAAQDVKNASDSATLGGEQNGDDSALSNLLDQQSTESLIQDGALSSDQNLIEN
jgi:tetratricopeptide (TPR) repeat protein